MAREKGMGNLQQEKSGRWTMRVCINGKRFSRSTRTTDKAKAERFLQKFLALLMSVIADIRRTASAADLAYQSFIKHCLQIQPYIKEGASTSDSFARFHHEMDEHRENRR